MSGQITNSGDDFDFNGAELQNATLPETALTLTDNTTNDVSTSKHGFAPKAPNDAAKFLRGDATWATIGGTGTALVASDPIWDAKGDLAAATGANAAVAVSVGANDTVLVADSGQAAGIKWAAVPGLSGYVPLATIDAKGDLLAGTANDALDNLTVGANGKILTAASGETTGLKWDSGYLGGLELVYKYTITGSAKASIDTGADTPDAGTNDWSNGDVLEVWIYARTAETAVVSSVDLVFNNDATAASYNNQRVSGANATASAGATVGAQLGSNVAGDSAAANVFGSFRISIPNYLGTVGFKVGELVAGSSDPTAANNTVSVRQFTYESTSALSRLKIVPTGGSNLKIGTQLLIYKRRNA